MVTPPVLDAVDDDFRQLLETMKKHPVFICAIYNSQKCNYNQKALIRSYN